MLTVANRIIVVSQQAEDREFAGTAASTAGLALTVRDSVKGAAAEISTGGSCIFLLDVSNQELATEFLAEFSGRIGKEPGKIDPKFIHLISSELFESSRSLLTSDCFGYFIVRRFGSPTEAGSHYGRVISRLCIEGNSSLLSLLGPNGRMKSMKILHSTEKKDVLEQVRRMLTEEIGYGDRIADIILTGVDEIVMNAIYDAPVDPDGNQKLTKLPRSTPVALDDSNFVELRMGHDGTNVGFTVVDRFGSLKKLKLLRHLFSANAGNEYEVDQQIANAGIGLATSFRAGGSLVFVSTPGVKTEVTLFFRIFKSFRDFKNQFKFISIQVE